MIDLLVREEHFTDREGFRPVAGRSDLLRAPPAAVERVRVRFSARVAPRVRERYPDCEAADGGAVVVTFQSSGVEWLVRRALEYGADAEVLEPAMFAFDRLGSPSIAPVRPCSPLALSHPFAMFSA
jgi:predicted DNA-binding transcriptional regulator YafY